MPQDQGDRRPGGLLRFFLRMPVWLYRMRLGVLLGHRFLLLTHIGRKSGLARQAVLEVVRRDEPNNCCIIFSGWGEQSDWFRNIQKNPAVKVNMAGHQFRATAVRLSLEEAQQELLDYARRNPVAFRRLAAWRLQEIPKEQAETCRLLSQLLPAVLLY